MKPILRIFAILAALAATSVAASSTHARTSVPQSTCSASVPNVSVSAGGLAASANDFGFRLLKALQVRAHDSNVFLSPTSLELALAMAYNGANGATAQAMASTLALHGGVASVRRQAATLLDRLVSSDPKAALTIANSLWARTGFAFRPQFVQQVSHAFAAKVTNLDFTSPSAPSIINSWVSCATHKTITSIVGRIPPQMVMYLINAVYFDGQWTHPFLSADTRQQTFTAAGAHAITVPMMSETTDLPYYKGPDFQSVGMPYGQGRFSMIVVLPNRGTPLSTFESRFTPASFKSWTAQMRPGHGSIALPRFQIANTFDLANTLKGLGMARAFSTTAADFSRLCAKQRCFISQVRHKTFLKVYEKGTIASAVTSVGVGTTAVPTLRFQIMVDHPFYVAIRDSATGSLLFLGAINNPQG
jgi:serine protease inhibitor